MRTPIASPRNPSGLAPGAHSPTFMKLPLSIIACLLLAPLADGGDAQPKMYRTPADLARMAEQAAKFPQIASAQEEILKQSADSVRAWRKKRPATTDPAEAQGLLSAGRESGAPPSLPDLLNNATAYVIRPSPELGEVIREQILYSVGARQKRGSWRDLGIHEGQRMMEFLKTYDLVAETGLLSAEERQIIKEEIHQAGHFFEAWTLDNDLSATQRGETYCLNINLYPASVLGAIAMYYPDLPESKQWLKLAQEQIVKHLLTEFALDGGYGEGSIHYFQPTMEALLEFMTASKNLGVRDYSRDEAVAAALKRALQWRTDLMGPDGRVMAIGDAHREQIGSAEFELAARLLGDPDLAWTGRQMVEQAQKQPAAAYMETSLDPLVADLSFSAKAPVHLFANYPWSGYVFFRSGWKPDDNYFVMKYGPTWVGRREAETHAVIPGHAHEDCLEIELHWSGLPMLVDPGIKGVYADYDEYGGYWKATISHNTVGLGNPHGYDRLDGQYPAHVQNHGDDFRYEQEQKVIGRADYEIKAVGDTGAAGIVSVAARTFENVIHERTAIWLKDNSVTVVFDQLSSTDVQPYEWYLHPVGKLLSDHADVRTFGDETARLGIVSIPLMDSKSTIIQQGDANVPPYYAALRADYKGPDPVDGKDARWPTTSLIVESLKAKSAAFLHVLVPYAKDAPYQTEALGSKGRKLSGKNDVILLSAEGNDDKTVQATGRFGFVRLQDNTLASYALHQGTLLEFRGEPLIKATLKSTVWESRYIVAMTALFSLKDRRASIGLPPPPIDRSLILSNIRSESEKGIAPVEVELSFKVLEKPRRIIAARSLTQMPVLNDSDWTARTSGWKPDPVSWRYQRREIDFQYDDAHKMVTLTLPANVTQLVWE